MYFLSFLDFFKKKLCFPLRVYSLKPVPHPHLYASTLKSLYFHVFSGLPNSFLHVGHFTVGVPLAPSLLVAHEIYSFTKQRFVMKSAFDKDYLLNWDN